MKNRAISYIRVSTGMQENGTSLENQEKQIEKYCDLKGFRIIDTITDTKSAKNLRRAGMQKVLSMAKKGEVDHVVVFRLDRAFRSTQDALDISKTLDKLKVGFHSVGEMLDIQSAMGEFFFTLMAAAAQLERVRLSERMKDACQLKREKGERMGNWIKYGYDLAKDGRKLKKNPKEQRVIQKIISLHEVARINKSEICKYLNAKNIPTKNNRKWHVQQIRNILKYEKIEGWKKPLRKGLPYRH